MTKRRDVTSIQAWAVRIDQTITEDSPDPVASDCGDAARSGGGALLRPDWELQASAA
jgi:hypothetical protein